MITARRDAEGGTGVTVDAIRAGIVTVEVGRLEAEERTALIKVAEEELARIGGEIVASVSVPANLDVIAEQVALMADRLHPHCIMTLGGTGLHPDDVTPDATAQVIHRPGPGIAELLRRKVGEHNPAFALTRGIAGTRGYTLIINLPDSAADLRLCFDALRPILPEAVARLARPDGKDAVRQIRLL